MDTCYFCNLPVKPEDKVALLVTQKGGPDKTVYAHKDCAENG